MVLWNMKHFVHGYAKLKCSSFYKAVMVMAGKACFILDNVSIFASIYLHLYLDIDRQIVVKRIWLLTELE